MASKEQLDRYAEELVRRFDELTRWAIENWPNRDFPLMQSDFAESRRELSNIVGPKLGEGNPDTPPQDDQREYIDQNPTPWP